jgi:hypothetical protein
VKVKKGTNGSESGENQKQTKSEPVKSLTIKPTSSHNDIHSVELPMTSDQRQIAKRAKGSIHKTSIPSDYPAIH